MVYNSCTLVTARARALHGQLPLAFSPSLSLSLSVLLLLLPTVAASDLGTSAWRTANASRTSRTANASRTANTTHLASSSLFCIMETVQTLQPGYSQREEESEERSKRDAHAHRVVGVVEREREFLV